MINLDSHLTFIGVDEKTGKARCGFLTDLIDRQDLPVQARQDEAKMTLITSSGLAIQFQLPEVLLTCLGEGADFWVGNIGGSEDAWHIKLDEG